MVQGPACCANNSASFLLRLALRVSIFTNISISGGYGTTLAASYFFFLFIVILCFLNMIHRFNLITICFMLVLSMIEMFISR
jgi:hypothetical protein